MCLLLLNSCAGWRGGDPPPFEPGAGSRAAISLGRRHGAEAESIGTIQERFIILSPIRAGSRRRLKDKALLKIVYQDGESDILENTDRRERWRFGDMGLYILKSEVGAEHSSGIVSAGIEDGLPRTLGGILGAALGVVIVTDYFKGTSGSYGPAYAIIALPFGVLAGSVIGSLLGRTIHHWVAVYPAGE
jgi:hypothetical protein